jgi:hypothetical protein
MIESLQELGWRNLPRVTTGIVPIAGGLTTRPFFPAEIMSMGKRQAAIFETGPNWT